MAYTKYSLTPANNTATPPDGAPEGMLPSAVNDTMRDMMAQIRDCGDGIRDGTYTMTAPKITGGTITGATVTSNTFSSSGATITGGTINSTAIGGTTAAAGKFTTLEATGVTTVQAGTVSLPAITTSGDTNTGIFFPAADTIAFTEGGTEAMRIDSSGNVGIGTATTGNSKLTVVASASGTGGIRVETQFGAGYFGNYNNYPAIMYDSSGLKPVIVYDVNNNANILYTNNTEKMRIDSSGNVGIGTSSPSEKLEINNGNLAVGNAGSNFTMKVSRTGANASSVVVGAFTNEPDIQWTYTGSGALRFTDSTASAERMRITSGGFLFVNTTSLVGDGYVSVSFNGSANVGMGLKSTHNGSFDVMRFVNYNNVQQGYINCNNSGSTTYNSGSDYRFKDNVKPMIDGLSKVMQLKPVTFNWKGDNSAGQGFIAHELAEIVPDVVSGEKDAVTEDGTIKPQGVDYGKLTAVLASAIQELNAKVEAQAARIAELESK